jgi:hypothetical protein
MTLENSKMIWETIKEWQKNVDQWQKPLPSGGLCIMSRNKIDFENKFFTLELKIILSNGAPHN